VKVEEKFNRRDAKLIEVQMPSINTGPQCALGIRAEFFTMPEDEDRRTLSVHLSPDEALELAEGLISAARRVRRG
jgi:hypothetical protein